ncbi:MAG TPA: ATP-binding protein [Thermomicrobiales bacterium]|nr:ATP-binding protein [Thermomicrobiales bacterium]
MTPPSRTQRPPLIIVNGPPASGKSTLGKEIAAELGIPLLSKDAIKEEMYDSLGKIERKISRRLGETSMRLMYTVARKILDAGLGVVIEANFYHGISEKDLSKLIAVSDAVMVHCTAPEEILKQRYIERAQSGERHPVHDDANRVDELGKDLDDGIYDPLNLGIPLIQVDSSDGFDPSVAEIVSRLQDGPVRAA